jgi:cytochrome c biogenesis protein CcmG/thiol:disulfide interchange protein DsbE
MELHKEMKEDGVIFAGVSLDEEGWEKVRPYANDMGINYPIMVDDGNVSRQYGPIRAIPTTLIINKKGQVEYVAPGMLTKEKLKPILTKLANR